jgi:hypothetical protein
MSKRLTPIHFPELAVVGLLFVTACGDSKDENATGSGGATTSGATTSGATAGASGASGSSSSSTAGAGGASSTGGSAGTGGNTSTAGTAGTGGSSGAAGSAGAGGAGMNLDASTSDARDGGCGPSGPLTNPTVPAALEVPAGATLVARYYAEGDQIYTCTASATDGGAEAGPSYAWVLKAPAATLYDNSCTAMGTHFAGPTWKSSDGSSVVGARVASAPSAEAGAIPQLLLKAASNSGEGIFATVTAVQRLDTKKGAAPADGCTAQTVDTDKSIAYSAVYYFYTGGSFDDGGSSSADASGQ